MLIAFEATFTLFFKDKKSKGSHKTLGIKVFLLDDRRIRIRTMVPDPGGSKTNPEHWFMFT
jgi:hypothetical protein